MPELRTIPNFPNYCVSDEGEIFRTKTMRRIKPVARDGYMRVGIFNLDGRKFVCVHTLVLETFVSPKPSPRHVGAHAPSNDRTNNAVTNLRWALPEENEEDKRAAGTKRNGVRRKLSAEEVQRIRDRAAQNESFNTIGRSMALHPYSVARIVRGLRRRETCAAAAE